MSEPRSARSRSETLKLRRAQIETKYAAEIEALYICERQPARPREIADRAGGTHVAGDAI
jgi:hypothetical protein